MTTHSFCRECNGTGWATYYSETLDGEFEEAYGLCPNCYAPRYCMGCRSGHPCPRPGIVRYGRGYYCNEHIMVIHHGGSVDNANKAMYRLHGPAASG